VTERSGEKNSSEMREKKGNMIRFGLVIWPKQGQI
jgi:hypothetical protein